MKLLRQIIEAISLLDRFRCGNHKFNFRTDAIAAPRAARRRGDRYIYISLGG